MVQSTKKKAKYDVEFYYNNEHRTMSFYDVEEAIIFSNNLNGTITVKEEYDNTNRNNN